MRVVLVLFVLSFVVYSKALDCGMSRINQDQFKKVVKECVKDNQTLSKIWDLASSISEEDDTSISSDEEVPVSRGLVNNMNTKNVKLTKSSRRSKRSRNSKGLNNDTPMSNVQRKNGRETSTTTEESTTIMQQSDENTVMTSVDESDDACVLQCIFEKLDMTDSNGLPDHKKFVSALLKTATGREIRDFLQESTDECFQQIEQGSTENSCEYSTKLVTCLAEKGRPNCEDWPVGNLPF